MSGPCRGEEEGEINDSPQPQQGRLLAERKSQLSVPASSATFARPLKASATFEVDFGTFSCSLLAMSPQVSSSQTAPLEFPVLWTSMT